MRASSIMQAEHLVLFLFRSSRFSALAPWYRALASAFSVYLKVETHQSQKVRAAGVCPASCWDLTPRAQ